jgi:hypothetical protein
VLANLIILLLFVDAWWIGRHDRVLARHRQPPRCGESGAHPWPVATHSGPPLSRRPMPARWNAVRWAAYGTSHGHIMTMLTRVREIQAPLPLVGQASRWLPSRGADGRAGDCRPASTVRRRLVRPNMRLHNPQGEHRQDRRGLDLASPAPGRLRARHDEPVGDAGGCSGVRLGSWTVGVPGPRPPARPSHQCAGPDIRGPPG